MTLSRNRPPLLPDVHARPGALSRVHLGKFPVAEIHWLGQRLPAHDFAVVIPIPMKSDALQLNVDVQYTTENLCGISLDSVIAAADANQRNA